MYLDVSLQIINFLINNYQLFQELLVEKEIEYLKRHQRVNVRI